MHLPPPSTTLRPPWVHLARAGWILLAITCIWLFVIGTQFTLRTPLPSCADPDAGCSANIQVTREDAQLATEMGLGVPLITLALAFSIAARSSLAIMGLIIFWRKSDDWVALIMSGGMMTVLLEGVQGFESPQNLVYTLVIAIGTALFLPIPFIFPSGKIQPAWMRWPMIFITTLYTLVVVFFLQTPIYFSFASVITILWTVLAIYAMPYRYARVSNAIERQQTKWVLLGLGATFMVAIYYTSVSTIYPAAQPSPARLVALLINLPLYLFGYGFFAFSILVAILRFRLWDIDLIIRRTLVYALLTSTLVLIYFGGIVVLQSIFQALIGQVESPLVTVISTLLIAGLFSPLRARIQDFIDRRFYRRKYNADQALAAFSATARDEVSLEALTGELAQVVQTTLEPENIQLWLREGRE